MLNKTKNDPIVNPSEKLLRGEDVAEILKISRAMAFKLIQRGQIAAIRIGRSVRVHRADLEAFIQRNRVAQENPL